MTLKVIDKASALALVCLCIAQMAFAEVTVSFTANIASRPDPAVELFGKSMSFSLEDIEFDVSGLPDNEYYIHDYDEDVYTWEVNNEVRGNGKKATISSEAENPSSPPMRTIGTRDDNGNNAVHHPDEYTITFTGIAYYKIGWKDENGEEHTGETNTVTLVASSNGSLSKDFIFFTMELITPAGDPTTTSGARDCGDGQNEFTFDSSTDGKLTMNLKASITPKSAAQYAAGNVSFEVASIGSATPSYSQVSSSDGYFTATATISGLPAHNSDFGQKTAKLKYNGEIVKTNPYEVFFSKDATNHPTCSPCANCPNWFFYWKEGEVCGIPKTAIFDRITRSYGWCNPKRDSIIRFGKNAAKKNSGSMTYTTENGARRITVTGSGKGIQCVAETAAHENNHLVLYKRLGNKTDTDGDGIADNDEQNLQNVMTLYNNPDTYQISLSNRKYAPYGDNEIRCRKVELDVTNYHPEIDWANPGCQSKEQFGPTP